MNERTRALVEQAGFRVFGDKIVAADQGSSGLATDCAQKLIALVVKECGNYLMSKEFLGRSDLDWSMVLNEHFGVKK